jgi:hypothetical protein
MGSKVIAAPRTREIRASARQSTSVTAAVESLAPPSRKSVKHKAKALVLSRVAPGPHALVSVLTSKRQCRLCTIFDLDVTNAEYTGYRESEARLGIDRAGARVGSEADIATLLKLALAALTET